MKKTFQNRRGITLIALVITIIVLLILAGVALATLTGNNNIIENANEAVGKYNNSVNEAQATMGDIENLFEKYVTGIPSTKTPEVDEDGLAKENVAIKPNPDSNVQIVIPKGFAPVILKGSNSTYSNPGQDGSVKEIMPADQWNNITVEQINKGIVIVDHKITYDNGQSSGENPDFNEFVWVSIPESGKFARTSWDGPYGDTESPEIGIHPISETSTENGFWEDKETEEYINMLASIEYYKGFYIGRYEASDDGASVAQSKRNQRLFVASQEMAIEAIKNNKIKNMHLMYGIEWDSTLNWLIGKAEISSSEVEQTKTMGLADVQSDSRSWGNYSNSTGNAATGSNTLQNTGYSEYWKANNIYDLAGNVFEWTQEKYSTGVGRTFRSGYYRTNGDVYPAAYRGDDAEYDVHYNERIPL